MVAARVDRGDGVTIAHTLPGRPHRHTTARRWAGASAGPAHRLPSARKTRYPAAPSTGCHTRSIFRRRQRVHQRLKTRRWRRRRSLCGGRNGGGGRQAAGGQGLARELQRPGAIRRYSAARRRAWRPCIDRAAGIVRRGLDCQQVGVGRRRSRGPGRSGSYGLQRHGLSRSTCRTVRTWSAAGIHLPAQARHRSARAPLTRPRTAGGAVPASVIDRNILCALAGEPFRTRTR